jgi:hypothetical protein
LPNNTKSTHIPQDGNVLEEWKSVREILAKFDDRILDLRKIGFSLLTALLAAQSLLIPSFYQTSSLPPAIKLTVIVATLLLIVTVRLIEKNYELFQEAAATRAVVLERDLNLEITETISERSRSDHFARIVSWVYIVFAIVAGVVGYFIILPSYQMSEIFHLGLFLRRTQLLVLMVLVTIGCIVWIGRTGLAFSHHGRDKSGELQLIPVDWTIDRLACKRGDFVRITLTNLDDPEHQRNIHFRKDETVCEISTEDSTWSQVKGATNEIKAKSDINILPQESYSWFWDTRSALKGKGPVRYKVVVKETESTDRGLLRRIRGGLTGIPKPKIETKTLRRKITVYK